MVDYSKWKDIEISDDEDDTHPNIDTASLFRWRHQARMERMQQHEDDKMQISKTEAEYSKKRREVHEKKAQLETGQLKLQPDQLEDLKKELLKLENEEQMVKAKKEELAKKEKLQPWNVDTISHEGFNKTVLNKAHPRKGNDNLSEEEKAEKQKQFVKENESLLKQFGMLRKYDSSKKFLTEHQHLACEETANYLVIWCINLEVEEKHELMEHVAHQCICMQYILELSKQLDVDPRACIPMFFSKIQMADKQYKDAFEDELRSFKERIQQRAEARLEKAKQEIEEEERKKRLGPGGLDPVEVFESLPESLQKCFETRDLELLQQIIAQLPEDEARYHMKRCVDSGLWIPDAGKAAESDDAERGE